MPRVLRSTEVPTSLPIYYLPMCIIISDVVINDKTIALLIVTFADEETRVFTTEYFDVYDGEKE